jgi:hypothetical protein
MDTKSIVRTGWALAVTIGLSLTIYWLAFGGPTEVVGTGLGLMLGGCSSLLGHLGIIGSDDDGGSDCGGDGGD